MDAIDAAKMSSVRRIIGPTILLQSGTYFDFDDPESADLQIEDVAYGLAYACRFAGQTYSNLLRRPVFYSVAEHCVRMSTIVPHHIAYDALMHELGEATCGDMTSPLKSICPDYRAVEKRCEAAAFKRFGVEMRNPELLKQYDMIMLATERRDLMAWRGEEWGWLPGIRPLIDVIIPWSPDDAAKAFLAAFDSLRPVHIKGSRAS